MQLLPAISVCVPHFSILVILQNPVAKNEPPCLILPPIKREPIAAVDPRTRLPELEAATGIFAVMTSSATGINYAQPKTGALNGYDALPADADLKTMACMADRLHHVMASQHSVAAALNIPMPKKHCLEQLTLGILSHREAQLYEAWCNGARLPPVDWQLDIKSGRVNAHAMQALWEQSRALAEAYKKEWSPYDPKKGVSMGHMLHWRDKYPNIMPLIIAIVRVNLNAAQSEQKQRSKLSPAESRELQALNRIVSVYSKSMSSAMTDHLRCARRIQACIDSASHLVAKFRERFGCQTPPIDVNIGGSYLSASETSCIPATPLSSQEMGTSTPSFLGGNKRPSPAFDVALVQNTKRR